MHHRLQSYLISAETVSTLKLALGARNFGSTGLLTEQKYLALFASRYLNELKGVVNAVVFLKRKDH